MEFMDAGGSVYVEGNDFGYSHRYDPIYEYFGCTYTGDGNSSFNVDHLYGEAGTMLDGRHLRYMYGQGPDVYVDMIESNGGTILFRDQINAGRLIKWDGEDHDYRSMHSTYVFGAMIDQTSPDTKDDVMAAYMGYLFPSVVVNLEPDATTIPQGGTLGYTATLVNKTDQQQTIYGRANVYLPGGSPFPGNPVVAPTQVTLNAGATVTVHYSHPVPAGAPLGVYTYEAQVGVPPANLIDDDLFEFEIVAP
ncbi:hypothetical protein AMJ71_03450 [candidate division TA06 bacterium SM1_40]|uniref:Uncharacterized protein n=1 Tax=candidate division TA06 bacterium SM1_40 TaxID=1703773 RepID=A0A0S8JNU1_UNCT6|nr:MAG: hypothetical protein AMJ71_03450 [candidate division TA06 bacterium SM1_40]